MPPPHETRDLAHRVGDPGLRRFRIRVRSRVGDSRRHTTRARRVGCATTRLEHRLGSLVHLHCVAVSPLTAFVLEHEQLVLFGAVLVGQLGVPLPLTPLLLGAGALAREGAASAPAAIAVSVVASSIAHVAWFYAGRWRGTSMLRLLCRISLEPDSCVRRTENLSARYGTGLLFIAPFAPGLGLVVPPLAGIAGMRLRRFLPFDAAGSLLFAALLIGAGYLLGPELAAAVDVLRRVGGSAASLALLLLVIYVGVKLAARRRLLRELRIARITPQELKRRMDAADPGLFVIDLRHPVEVQAAGWTLPGALRMSLEELDARHAEIPRDREIALYCS